MQTLLRYVIKIASAVTMLFTLFSYICPLVDPSVFQWLAFFGTAFPWLLIFNILLMLFWIWDFNRFALYHVGILVFGIQHITGFIGIDYESDHVPERAITVATHNLGGIYPGKSGSGGQWREERIAAYAKMLQENGFPDILCTQETSGKFYRQLAEKMGYPHSFNLKKGTVILSRFPIEASGEVAFDKAYNSVIWADIRVSRKRLVRVYNAHLQSNRVTGTTTRVIQSGELDDEETWQDIGFVLDRVGSATARRAQQARKLREHINACKVPVILCGDFNDTPSSYVYSLLSDGFTDTYREKGFGVGTTFAGALPLLRIDYILTERSISAHSCKVVRAGSFSDHYPVFASLSF